MHDAALVQDARTILAANRTGLLSTHSAQHPGYPFGSLTPYALNGTRQPVLWISALAMHTKNLVAEPRCSLLVLEEPQGEDRQAVGRVTLLGTCQAVEAHAVASSRDAWLQAHPHTAQHMDLGDFAFFVMTVEHVRVVSGFGRMGWLAGTDITG